MASDPGIVVPRLLGGHVFISYAREDAATAARLQSELVKAGVASVWTDRKEIEGGDDWKKEINDGLLRTQLLVALLSRHSVDKERRWIRYEHSEAMRLLRPIVPALIADCDLPPHLEDLQYVDFRHDWNEGFVALLNSIGKITPRAGESERKFTDQSPPLTRSFVGREHDIRNVFKLMEGDSHGVPTGRRSVAIQGMGGSGKSMLAEELVRRLGARYPGGVAVEQRGPRPESAQAVFQRWAKCILGDYPQPQWTVADVRSELQRRYGELLILIDDVAEKDAADVEQLLKALPPDASRLLTTRWQDIESLGCVVYHLSDFGEADGLLLLRDRLRSKGEDPGEEALKRLISTVGGHALSLELVAGCCKHAGDLPEQIDRLARRLAAGDVGRIALNALGSRNRKDHSVAASLEESYRGLEEFDLLSGTDWTRRFRALGVFPDGATFDRSLAAAVWSDDDPDNDQVPDSLDGLYSRAMLNRDSASGLYFSHPLLRAYACGLLKSSPPEYATVWSLYVRYVTKLAGAGFNSPPEEWQRLEPLRPHLLHIGAELVEVVGSSLRADVGHLARPEWESGREACVGLQELEEALEFALAVAPYIIRRPETGDRGRRCLELGLACARGLQRDPEVVRFLRALGQWHEPRMPGLAERYYERGLAAASDREADQATLLSCLGELQRKTSRPGEAMRTLEQALSMHEQSGNRRMQAVTLRSMGETQWRLGRHDDALALHRRALDIFVSTGNRSGQGDILNKIGSVRFNQGLHQEAIRLFEEALHIHREVGNRSMEAEDLNDMGIAFRYLGDLENALPRLIDAYMIHRAIGNRRLQAISMCNIASVYLLQGLLQATIAMVDDAMPMSRETADLVTEAWGLSYKGIALQKQGQTGSALPCFLEAVEKSRKVGDRRGEAGHLGNAAGLHLELGDREKALALLRQAVDVMKTNRLTQAFGGRRMEDFNAMIDIAKRL